MVTKFGLQISSYTYPGVTDADLFSKVVEIATTAESSGFDSLWVMDHQYQLPMIGPAEEPMFEAYTLLGALAASTNVVRLGTLVTGVTYRNPAILAKQITAVDVISKGRAVLGIGAAWFEMEHLGLGVEFPPDRERLDRLEEALQICKAMFTDDRPTFEGRFYQIHDALNYPRPVQVGGPPILIGGGGERRTLRLVAKYGDACNVFGSIEEAVHKMSVLDRHCNEVGRDPAEITKTRYGLAVIGESEADASRRTDEVSRDWSIDRQALDASAFIGGPDQLVEFAGRMFDAGLDGLIFSLPQAHDVDMVSLAGETLVGAFGSV